MKVKKKVQVRQKTMTKSLRKKMISWLYDAREKGSFNVWLNDGKSN